MATNIEFVDAARAGWQHAKPKAKWMPDVTLRHELRYWDGDHWTHRVSDQGQQGTDPIDSGPDSPNWMTRFDNATLRALRQEVVAARFGIPVDEYRAMTHCAVGDLESHPEKVARLHARLAAEDVGDGSVRGGSMLRGCLNAERIRTGTSTALAWCKHCDAVTVATPRDAQCAMNFRCSGCGHGVKDVRVVPTPDADRVRAELAAAARSTGLR